MNLPFVNDGYEVLPICFSILTKTVHTLEDTVHF